MNQELIVTIIIAVLGSNAFLAIVNAIISAIEKKRKKPSNSEKGLMWLMQDKLDFLMTKEIQRGETTRSMKSFIHKGHDLYHALGGNGDMNTLLKVYDNLEVDYGH